MIMMAIKRLNKSSEIQWRLFPHLLLEFFFQDLKYPPTSFIDIILQLYLEYFELFLDQRFDDTPSLVLTAIPEKNEMYLIVGIGILVGVTLIIMQLALGG